MAEAELMSASMDVLLQKAISVTAENIDLVFGSQESSGSLNTMTKNLFSHSSEETNLVQTIREELESLEGSLSIIQAVSRDNLRLQDKAENIKHWLQKLGGLAYNADDVLAEFAYEILPA